jgi:hypothetical protein
MLALPKVRKGVKGAQTGMKGVQKAIAGVALALGVAFAGVTATEAQASPAAQTVQQSGGSLLLVMLGQPDVVADHYSHSSHASHASHYSHYSSRYSG